MHDIDRYLTENAARFEDDLCELLAIPSVSADSRHKPDMARAADWVADTFRRLGLAVETIPTSGHPLVYAESPAVPGAPTVLVYGHYDVQPPDPLGEWISPPFEPTRRDGNASNAASPDSNSLTSTSGK